jgi:hypothetical protein
MQYTIHAKAAVRFRASKHRLQPAPPYHFADGVPDPLHKVDGTQDDPEACFHERGGDEIHQGRQHIVVPLAGAYTRPLLSST